MSNMKRFAEEVSVELGLGGEINDAVMAEAQKRIDQKTAQIPRICWEFDRNMFCPVKMKFLQINDDGWMRFQYLETHSSSSEYTSLPPNSFGIWVFSTKEACIFHMLHRLTYQLQEIVGEQIKL